MNSVSVIVLTANRLGILRQCLQSLSSQTHPPKEVIVVDNGSTDGTAEFLATNQTTFPIRVLRRDGSGSFAKARNEGVKAATSDGVAFLDDDCEADRFWLERLLAEAELQGAAAVGGAVLPADELAAPEHFPPEAVWAAGLFSEGFFGNEGGRRFLPTTSNLLVRRELLLAEPFQELDGAFAEGVEVYRLGREDAEWWRRMRQQGQRLGIARRAIVWHHVPQERLDWTVLKRRAALDGSAHWGRAGTPEDVEAALRDFLAAPRELSTELMGNRGGLRERLRGKEIWLARQLGLLAGGMGSDKASGFGGQARAAFRAILGELRESPRALASGIFSQTAPWLQQSLRERDLVEAPPERLLIVLHDLLGDAVLATPLLKCLERELPETELIVLCGQVGGPVLRASGLRRTKLVRVVPGATGRGPVAQARLLRQLMELRADSVLIAYLHGLSPLPFFALGVPVVSWKHDNGFGHRFWGELVTHPVPKSMRKHEVAALLDLAAPFGARATVRRPVLIPRAKASGRAESIVVEAGWTERPFAVLHVERGGRWKIWPPERFEALAARLVAEGYGVFLVGGRGDRPLGRGIARRVGKGCESLHGQIDSEVLAALLGRASLFVGCDSGPAHVAQAVGCTSVMVFGGTEPWRWGPLPALAGEDKTQGNWTVVQGGPGDWLAEEHRGLPADAAMQLAALDVVWNHVKRAFGVKENFSPGVESH